MGKIFDTVKEWNRRLGEDAVAAYSAQAAFFVIISLFPLLMLLAACVRFLPWDLAEMMDFLFSILPVNVQQLAGGILDEIYTNSTNLMLSLTAFVAVWSSSRGVYALLQGVRAVHHPTKNGSKVRNWQLRALSVVYTVLLIIILLLVMVLWVFGNSLQNLLLEWVPMLSEVDFLLSFLRLFVGLCMLVLFCMLLYTAARPRSGRFYRYFPGALLSSLGWMGFSYAYSFYISHFSNMSYFYGSLSAVVLMMLWLYFCLYILLVGAEFNEWINEKRAGKEK